MSETSSASSSTALPEQMFPILTAEQIKRIAAHGHVRQVGNGEVLSDAGSRNLSFYVVTDGELELRPDDGSNVIALLKAGMFTGEMTLLSGRRGLVQLRGHNDAEV